MGWRRKDVKPAARLYHVVTVFCIVYMCCLFGFASFMYFVHLCKSAVLCCCVKCNVILYVGDLGMILMLVCCLVVLVFCEPVLCTGIMHFCALLCFVPCWWAACYAVFFSSFFSFFDTTCTAWQCRA